MASTKIICMKYEPVILGWVTITISANAHGKILFIWRSEWMHYYRLALLGQLALNQIHRSIATPPYFQMHHLSFAVFPIDLSLYHLFGPSWLLSRPHISILLGTNKSIKFIQNAESKTHYVPSF